MRLLTELASRLEHSDRAQRQTGGDPAPDRALGRGAGARPRDQRPPRRGISGSGHASSKWKCSPATLPLRRTGLRDPPADTTHEWAHVALLRGMLAELRWQFDLAITHYREAQALNPQQRHGLRRSCPGLTAQCRHSRRARATRQACETAGPCDLVAWRFSQCLAVVVWPEILDEYRLEKEALDEMTALRGQSPTQRIGPLLDLVRRFPDYTPAAINLLIALRQAGRLNPPVNSAKGPQLHSAVDRPILGFARPAGRSARPDADLDSRQSRFRIPAVRRHRGSEVPRCLRPGGAAGVSSSDGACDEGRHLRLAWLFAHGGYYADADDRCLGAIETVIPPGAMLVPVWEDVCAIAGNNFIGAVPQHVIIRARP